MSNLSKWRKLAAEGKLGRERFQQAKVVRSAMDPATFFGNDFARVEAQALARAKKICAKKWLLFKRKLRKLAKEAARKVRPDGC